MDPGHPRRGGAAGWHPGTEQPGTAGTSGREGALARDPQLGCQHRSGVRPKRTAVVALCTAPPQGSTVICADELGPAIPLCALSRNGVAYQDSLRQVEQANPEGTIHVITDNLSSHNSKATRAWL